MSPVPLAIRHSACIRRPDHQRDRRGPHGHSDRAEQGDLDGSAQDAELSERDEVSVEDQVIITVTCWNN